MRRRDKELPGGHPYVASNPVRDSPAFIGWVDVLRVLRRSQDNAIVLYGQRHKGG